MFESVTNKIELSQNNHFRFGYNGFFFNSRNSKDDTWNVQYGRCSIAPGNFGEECVRTAQLIRESTGLPLWILFSGGIDSEVVVKSFERAGIPFRIAILRFANALNQHDIRYAVAYCEQNSLQYNFFDLDLLHFWEISAHDFARNSKCRTVRMLATMWLMDQIDGYPILGSGECHLLQNPSTGQWVLSEKEKIAAWYRHLQYRGRSGCPGFFQYTPEIMLSYLQDPIVTKLVQNKFPNWKSSVDAKHSVYSSHFPLVAREKFTGYEQVEKSIALKTIQEILRNNFGAWNQECLSEVETLAQALHPDYAKSYTVNAAMEKRP